MERTFGGYLFIILGGMGKPQSTLKSRKRLHFRGDLHTLLVHLPARDHPRLTRGKSPKYRIQALPVKLFGLIFKAPSWTVFVIFVLIKYSLHSGQCRMFAAK